MRQDLFNTVGELAIKRGRQSNGGKNPRASIDQPPKKKKSCC